MARAFFDRDETRIHAEGVEHGKGSELAMIKMVNFVGPLRSWNSPLSVSYLNINFRVCSSFSDRRALGLSLSWNGSATWSKMFRWS